MVIITIIQSDLVWQNIDANLELFTQKINNIGTPTNIVLLPEMFSTGFSMNAPELAETMQGKAVTWMKEMAMQKKIIIAGSLIIKENEKYYNRFVWMQPDGNFHSYDKRHLFSLAQEDKTYTAGDKKILVQVNGIKFCLQICYDLRFPVWSRQSKKEPYDCLIYVANWPTVRIATWDALLKARAIENQCVVIGVNRIGIDGKEISYNGSSAIINCLGETLYNKCDAEDVFTFEFDKKHINEVRERMKFLNDGDDFLLT
jgi:omega-amidase